MNESLVGQHLEPSNAADCDEHLDAADSNQSELKKGFPRLWGVITRPSRALDDIARNPDVITPLAVIGTTSLVLNFVTAPKAIETASKIVGTSVEVSPRVWSVITAVAVLSGTVGSVVVWMLSSVVLYLALKMASGRGTPRLALSVFGYAALPKAIGTLVQSASIAISGSIPQSKGLAAAFPHVQNIAMKALLQNANVFSLWTAALMVLAANVGFRIPLRRSLLILVSYWSIGLVLQVAVMRAALH